MSKTLKEIVAGAKHLKNEYRIHIGFNKGAKESKLSDEDSKDFLDRVFHDYSDRPAFLDERGYIMLSIFGGEEEFDNIHNKERGDHYYKLYIRDIL